jgi:hypothetical protein
MCHAAEAAEIAATLPGSLTLAVADKLQDTLPLANNVVALTQFDFGSRPSLYDLGAIAFGEALTTNVTLQRLHFRRQHIRNINALQALADGLRVNRTLTYLDLGSNYIDDHGGVALGDALASGTALRYLNLVHNNIGPLAAAALGRALASNCSLTELHLGDNVVLDAGAVALAAALSTNTTLTYLDLQYNAIGENAPTPWYQEQLATGEVAAALTAMMRQNTTLKTLNLVNNGMQVGVDALRATRDEGCVLV